MLHFKRILRNVRSPQHRCSGVGWLIRFVSISLLKNDIKVTKELQNYSMQWTFPTLSLFRLSIIFDNFFLLNLSLFFWYHRTSPYISENSVSLYVFDPQMMTLTNVLSFALFSFCPCTNIPFSIVNSNVTF